MTNKQKGMPYDKATPETVALARELVEGDKRHRYSTAATFKAHNTIFNLNEVPSTCTSCVVNRAKAVLEWLKGYDAWAAQQAQTSVVPSGAEETTPAEEPAAPAPKTVPPVKGKVRKAATPPAAENEDLT